MDKSLAKGYARQLFESVPDVSVAEDYFNTPKYKIALKRFNEIAVAKKPDLIARKMRKVIPRQFTRVAVRRWRKDYKYLEASGLFSNRRMSVVTDQDAFLYREPAILMGHGFFKADLECTSTGIMATASLSNHAIARLLARDAVRPQELVEQTTRILTNATYFLWSAMSMPKHDLSLHDLNFVLPYRDGALVCRTASYQPMTFDDGEPSQRGISVRTWLSPDMISSDLSYRMALLEDHGRLDAWESHSAEAIVRCAAPHRHRRDENGELRRDKAGAVLEECLDYEEAEILCNCPACTAA